MYLHMNKYLYTLGGLNREQICSKSLKNRLNVINHLFTMSMHAKEGKYSLY